VDTALSTDCVGCAGSLPALGPAEVASAGSGASFASSTSGAPVPVLSPIARVRAIVKLPAGPARERLHAARAGRPAKVSREAHKATTDPDDSSPQRSCGSRNGRIFEHSPVGRAAQLALAASTRREPALSRIRSCSAVISSTACCAPIAGASAR
jgi:hypothetical protein